MRFVETSERLILPVHIGRSLLIDTANKYGFQEKASSFFYFPLFELPIVFEFISGWGVSQQMAISHS